MTLKRRVGVRPLLVAGYALVGLLAPGCERGAVDQHVDQIKRDAHAMAQDAKRTADRLEQKLPAPDQVRAELARAGSKVDDKLHAAGERLKGDLKEASESAREKLSKDK